MFHIPKLTPWSFRQYRLHLAAILSLVLIAGLYSVINAQITLTGQHVLELQDRVERLERENTALELDIARETSYAKIEARARALGLRPAKPEQMIYLIVKNYPASPKPMQVSDVPGLPAPGRNEGILAGLDDLLSRVGLGSRSNTVEAGASP